MRISQETDYAVRCVLHLSRQPDYAAPVDSIVRSMAMPRSFTAKIMQRLVRAGLALSRRGPGGGFRLARSPQEISLYDVVLAIEGPIAFNRCAYEGHLCEIRDHCSVHSTWIELSRRTEAYLRKKNFARLARTPPVDKAE